jgi:signal transduction histidine kinase
MLRPDGTTEQLAVAHVDPAKVELARELRRRYPRDPNAARGVPQVSRTGQAELLAEIPDTLLVAAAHDPEHLRIARELGLRSAMIVPLTARGRTWGAITLVAAESGRRYGRDDLAFAEELARRAALAIDNARLYREAQDAIGARDEFLSVAAHELRTPLATLSAQAQLALRQLDRTGQLEPERAARTLRAITHQAGRLSGLIGQLLDISRIQGGQLVLEPRPTDLCQLLVDVAAAAHPRTEAHQITVRAPTPVTALVDPSRLEQVLTNLLDNAIKYSPAGGPIELTLVQPSDTTVEFAVRDHGLGIPPERRQDIFERFYQAHSEGYRSGMGLGLYISRQIVELHGGTIAAEFPDDGGTCFRVRLPLSPSPRRDRSDV